MAYRQVPEHPKFSLLKTFAKCKRFEALGLLECLWHLTAKLAPRGDIGRLLDVEIEAWMEWEGEEGAAIAALVRSRWIDADPEHRLIVHDWHIHADDATDLKLARAQQTYANGALPRMRRLSKSDREALQEKYAHSEQVVQECAHVVGTYQIPDTRYQIETNREQEEGCGTFAPPESEGPSIDDLWLLLVSDQEQLVSCLCSAAKGIPKFQKAPPELVRVEKVIQAARESGLLDGEIRDQIGLWALWCESNPSKLGGGAQRWWLRVAKWLIKAAEEKRSRETMRSARRGQQAQRSSVNDVVARQIEYERRMEDAS